MYLVLDTETSGLEPYHDQIIDIHAMLMNENGETSTYFGAKVKPEPGVIVSPEAAKVNGYPAGWDNAVSLEVAKDKFNHTFKGMTLQLVGWNPGFDMNFLRAGNWVRDFKLEYHTVDVYSLLIPYLTKCPITRKGGKRPTLADAFKFLVPGCELPEFHSAVGDVLACVKLFQFVMQGVKR